MPIIKGHIHTKQDLFFRKHILNLMCDFETAWHESEFMEYCISLNYDLLDQLEGEDLIEYGETGMKVLPMGREVIRIICSALDARLCRSNRTPQFSKAV